MRYLAALAALASAAGCAPQTPPQPTDGGSVVVFGDSNVHWGTRDADATDAGADAADDCYGDPTTGYMCCRSWARTPGGICCMGDNFCAPHNGISCYTDTRACL